MMNKENHNAKKKVLLILFVIVIALITAVGGVTWALLSLESTGVTNSFRGGTVEDGIVLLEDFNGTVKKNVNVQNNGTFPVYLRVKLTSYRVNEDGDRIGGYSEIPDFSSGDGWLFCGDGVYIYNAPVATGKKPANPLIGNEGITLKEYDDVDGGKQVIEVVADSYPVNDESIKTAWNVDITDGNILVLN